MTTRPRDSQRSRLYAAENLAQFRHTGQARSQTIANDALQAYVQAVYDRPTFQRRWPSKRVPTVVLGKGGGYAEPYFNRISLGVQVRNEWTVLHEIAHLLQPQDTAWHGPEFAGILLWLIEDNLGKEAALALRLAFTEKKVRKSSKGIPAPLSREEERLRAEVRRLSQELEAAKVALREYRKKNMGVAA